MRAKLAEELEELDQAIASGGREAMEHELGDVLFSLGNLARFLRTPAEDALRAANARFTRRFHAVEAGLRQRGVAFGTATLGEMDALWQEAKRGEPLLPSGPDGAAGHRPAGARRRSCAGRALLGTPRSSAGLGPRVVTGMGGRSRPRAWPSPTSEVRAATPRWFSRRAPEQPAAVRAAGGELLSEAPVVFR